MRATPSGGRAQRVSRYDDEDAFDSHQAKDGGVVPACSSARCVSSAEDSFDADQQGCSCTFKCNPPAFPNWSRGLSFLALPLRWLAAFSFISASSLLAFNGLQGILDSSASETLPPDKDTKSQAAQMQTRTIPMALIAPLPAPPPPPPLLPLSPPPPLRPPPSLPPAVPRLPLPPVMSSPSLPPSEGLPICLGDLRAEDVAARDEGSFGTTDPVLWVFEEAGNFETSQQTASQLNTLSPIWPEVICLAAVRMLPCFEIRDDYDPHFPRDRPPLLHTGCVSSSWGFGPRSVTLTSGATIFFTVRPRMPDPPPAPPLMPQPQLPPPSTRMADRINLDFRNGRPSNNLEGAGVILHQFDAMDDRDPDHHPWELGIGRRDTGDRVSAAIVNAQMQPDPSGNIPIYSFSLAGLVLSPTHNNLMCSYSWDVGSMERKCWPQGLSDICIPGCSRGNNDREPWCAAGSGDWKFRNPPCAWRPQNLADMLAARDEVRNNQLRPPGKMWNDNKYYTELIFETRSYTLHLPDSIMGVFYLDGNRLPLKTHSPPIAHM